MNASVKCGWRRAAFSNIGEARALAEDVRVTFPDIDINDDIEWLCITHGWPENDILVLADHSNTGIRGVASFLVSNASLDYSLGGFSFGRAPVRQLKLFRGPRIDSANPAEAIGSFFKTLSDELAGGVVYVGAVPVGSDLHRELVSPDSPARRRFHVLPWGKESYHCRIQWDCDVAAYLSSIGKESARSLRRYANALLSDPTLKCELRRFHSPEDIDIFFRDGAIVSDRSRKKSGARTDFSTGCATERVIRFAASRGAFFGYILYINDAPGAFLYGFLHGRICTMRGMAYDAAWSRRQIGGVLFFRVLQDFEDMKVPATCLDFMPDLTLFKLRTTNEHIAIRHFYLFPRTLRGTIQYMTLKATDWVSRRGGALIKRRKGELEQYLSRLDAGRGRAATSGRNGSGE